MQRNRTPRTHSHPCSHTGDDEDASGGEEGEGGGEDEIQDQGDHPMAVEDESIHCFEGHSGEISPHATHATHTPVPAA